MTQGGEGTADRGRLARRMVLKAGALLALPPVLARADLARGAPAAPSESSFPRPPLGMIALSRLGFGPAGDDLAAFDKLGGADGARLEAWLRVQLRPDGLEDGALDARLAPLGSLGKGIPHLWKTYYRGAPEGERKYEVIWTPTAETRLAVFLRMVYSRRQLQEVMAGFWRDHFNVHPDKDERIPPLLGHYDAALRRHALGNFRALLGEVSRHPVMLLYLDNASSTRAGPNENFARELFELHTLGAMHYGGVGRQSAVKRDGDGRPQVYVDDDVYEATRVLTGWRVADDPEGTLGDSGEFVYDQSAHDRFQKTVLGTYFPPNGGQQEGEVLLDVLAAHPGTARHVALKLARRLISETPPPALVEQAAQTFLRARAEPDQLAQVVGVLARSPAFAASWGDKFRRPLEGLAAACRALGTDVRWKAGDFWQAGWLGQEVYGWAPPNGAPDARGAWSGSGHLLRRWTMARALAENWWDDGHADLFALTPADLRTPLALADHWGTRLTGQPLGAEARRAVALQLSGGSDNLGAELTDEQRRERLPGAVAFALMAPGALVT